MREETVLYLAINHKTSEWQSCSWSWSLCDQAFLPTSIALSTPSVLTLCISWLGGMKSEKSVSSAPFSHAVTKYLSCEKSPPLIYRIINRLSVFTQIQEGFCIRLSMCSLTILLFWVISWSRYISHSVSSPEVFPSLWMQISFLFFALWQTNSPGHYHPPELLYVWKVKY